jgi:hypothetical protein
LCRHHPSAIIDCTSIFEQLRLKVRLSRVRCEMDTSLVLEIRRGLGVCVLRRSFSMSTAKPQLTFVTGNAKKLEVRILNRHGRAGRQVPSLQPCPSLYVDAGSAADPGIRSAL